MPTSPKTPKRLRKASGVGANDTEDAAAGICPGSQDSEGEDGEGGSGDGARRMHTCVLRSTVPFGLRRKHMRSTLLCSRTLFHPRSSARVDLVPVGSVAAAHLLAELALGEDPNDGRPGLVAPGIAAGRAYFVGGGGAGSPFAKFARLQARVDRAQCSLAMPAPLCRALAQLNELGSRVLCFAPWTKSLAPLAVEMSCTTCLFDCSRAQQDLGCVAAARCANAAAAARALAPPSATWGVCTCALRIVRVRTRLRLRLLLRGLVRRRACGNAHSATACRCCRC